MNSINCNNGNIFFHLPPLILFKLVFFCIVPSHCSPHPPSLILLNSSVFTLQRWQTSHSAEVPVVSVAVRCPICQCIILRIVLLALYGRPKSYSYFPILCVSKDMCLSLYYLRLSLISLTYTL